MKRRIISLLLCSVMLTVGLTGCGQGQKEVKRKDGKDEKVSLTFTHLFVEGESWNDAITPAIERFNKDHADSAEIIVEEMPQDAYLTQINARGTADDLSELVMVKGTMMKAFSDIGAIIDLTDVYKDIGLEQVLRPGLIQEGTNIDDDAIYSFPIALGTYGFILYNENIFKEAGISEFPATLDEFNTACAKLRELGYIPMALGDRDPWAADSILFSAFVNNFVGNEWYQNIRKCNGKASFTDKEFVDALAAYQNIAKNHGFNDDFASISNDERLALYTNGKAAMISAGDWECKNIDEMSPEISSATKAAHWPGPASGSKAEASIVQSAAWGIAMGSRITEEQIEAVKIFLKDYFYTEETGKIIVEENNEFTAWEVDYDESKLVAPAVEMNKRVKDGTACMNWDSTLDPTIKEIYQRGLQELLMQSIDPKELAQNMQDEYELLQ